MRDKGQIRLGLFIFGYLIVALVAQLRWGVEASLYCLAGGAVIEAAWALWLNTRPTGNRS